MKHFIINNIAVRKEFGMPGNASNADKNQTNAKDSDSPLSAINAKIIFTKSICTEMQDSNNFSDIKAIESEDVAIILAVHINSMKSVLININGSNRDVSIMSPHMDCPELAAATKAGIKRAETEIDKLMLSNIDSKKETPKVMLFWKSLGRLIAQMSVPGVLEISDYELTSRSRKILIRKPADSLETTIRVMDYTSGLTFKIEGENKVNETISMINFIRKLHKYVKKMSEEDILAQDDKPELRPTILNVLDQDITESDD